MSIHLKSRYRTEQASPRVLPLVSHKGDASGMTVNCPPIAGSLVIAEDARLAAQISCALAVPRRYLPVIEGPRLLPPDPVAKLVRRNNAVARVRPERLVLLASAPVLLRPF